MTLLVYGINHRTTPINLREKIAFSREKARYALADLMRRRAVNEAMILSTCNRVEVYGDITDSSSFQNWLSQSFEDIPNNSWYSFYDEKAVSHIMRVASGLDSMVRGEPQILGQMKDAFALAKESGSIGNRLHRLFQTVFNITKQVRTQTGIGSNPITFGYAVVTLAKHIFSDLSKSAVLLIGAGEVVELAALHLYKQGIKRFIVANRSLANGEKLAQRVYGHCISFADIPIYLKESDIIVSATSSELPILGKGAVERAIKARKHKPIFIVDLAVPRDIAPEVADLEDIYLYNIDDLKTIIEDNRIYREAAAKEAESIIEIQARHYMFDIQSLEANNLISDYRKNLTALSEKEYELALHSLHKGVDPEKVLKQFAQNLIKKIAHSPCIQMKQAAFDGRLEFLALARQLLDIN